MDVHEKKARKIVALLADLFEISAVYGQGDQIVFSLSFRFDHDKSRSMIEDRLKTAGYEFRLKEEGEGLLLSINPNRRLNIPTLNIVLFVVTLLTVYFVPVFLRHLGASASLTQDFQSTLKGLAHGEGLVFTLALISILFVHEMGHYVASRRRNIVTSWPYFIPAPNIIGTFGAVIKSKSPFWNRRDLIEVGAAGPIAGWIVAIAWLWVGLSHSMVLPQDAFGQGDMLFSMDGESVLMRLSTWLLVGSIKPGHYLMLSEAAFAGWVGMLVTAINMLPIGQLDGGHVVYGLARRHQHIMGKLATAGLVLLGFHSPMWWFFAAFGLFFGMSHPPTLDDQRPVSPAAQWMGWIALVILLLSFTPVPFR